MSLEILLIALLVVVLILIAVRSHAADHGASPIAQDEALFVPVRGSADRRGSPPPAPPKQASGAVGAAFTPGTTGRVEGAPCRRTGLPSATCPCPKHVAERSARHG